MLPAAGQSQGHPLPLQDGSAGSQGDKPVSGSTEVGFVQGCKESGLLAQKA
jgi:hypothetical protein